MIITTYPLRSSGRGGDRPQENYVAPKAVFAIHFIRYFCLFQEHEFIVTLMYHLDFPRKDEALAVSDIISPEVQYRGEWRDKLRFFH